MDELKIGGYLIFLLIVLIAKYILRSIQKSAKYSDTYKRKARIIVLAICIVCLIGVLTLRYTLRLY